MLEQFKDKVTEIKEKIQPLLAQLKARKVPKTSQGLSYLEVKYHLLLSYCINICFYLLLKTEGRSVKNHPVIEQLVRTRVTLEKMRPLDQRLKYQVDKLLKMATLGEGNVEIDPKLKHKPNLRAFASVNETSDAEENGEDDPNGAASGGKYRAPKLASATYEDNTEKRDRRRKKDEEKARKSGMAQFLVEEYDDQPLSRPLTVGQELNPEDDEEERDRIRYEEETFTRQLLSKKDKKKRKRTQFTDDLADLDDFSDLTALTKTMAQTCVIFTSTLLHCTALLLFGGPSRPDRLPAVSPASGKPFFYGFVVQWRQYREEKPSAGVYTRPSYVCVLLPRSVLRIMRRVVSEPHTSPFKSIF